MITVIVDWQAPPQANREQLIEEFSESIPLYKGRDHLIRKYIVYDPETNAGKGIYLWDDRAAAEAFYAMAAPKIREETGHDPVISYFETPILVDNQTGETSIYS